MRRFFSAFGVLVLSLALMAQSTPLNNFDSGSTSTPSRAYRVDPQLGSYRIQSSNEGLASDGRLRWHWSGTLIHLTSGLELRVGGGGFFQSSVGIGTDNPASMLHVVGTMALTGTLATQGGVAIGGVSAPTLTLHVGGTSSVSGAATFLSSVTVGNAGQVLIPLGTAATPSVAPSAEVGNGLYQNAASQMGFSQGLHVTGALHAQTSFALGAHMVTIANNADAGTANTELLAGTRSLYLIDCNDPQGCTLQLGTSNIVQGATTRIFNISTNANVVTMGNVTSVQHVQSLFTMSTNHTIGFMFISNRSGASIWAETNRNGRAL